MADQDDVIRIDLESDVSEGEAAKRKLAEVGKQVDQLQSSFAAGQVGLATYKAEMRDLAREMGKAQKAIDAYNDAQVKSGKVRLSGADRASAKAQFGFFAANTAQDAIQGGPASTINNILGAAGNGKIRALAGEYLDMAGGVAGVAKAFGTVAIAAGSAFLLIDTGLKNAKLGWSDLGEVAANTAPFEAVSETIAGIGVILKDWGVTGVLDSAYDAAESFVGSIADATIGWGEATAAAKAHKEQVEGQVKAARSYAEAVKDLSKIQSDAQQEQAKRGKLFGEQFANLGGAEGVDGLIGRLAAFETAKTGQEKIKIKDVRKGDDGKEVVEDIEVTRAEAARRRLVADLGLASKGDVNAQNRLTAQAQSFGLDTRGLAGAARGEDADKEAKVGAKADDSYLKEQIRDAEKHADDVGRAYDKKVGDISKPLQDRFNASIASGNRIDEGAMQGKLKSLGYDSADAQKFAKPVLEALQQGYNEDVRERASKKGLTFAGGAQDLLAEYRQKEADDARRKADTAESRDDKAKRDRAEEVDRRLAGTGVNERARADLMRQALGGVSPAEAMERTTARLSQELQRSGMGQADADKAARERIDKEGGELGDDIVKRAMAGAEGSDKGLEHYAAGDFTRQVESAGADVQRGILDTSKKSLDVLSEISRKTGGAATYSA